MKVFFDTNVYIAEALLGKSATRIINKTRRAKWRIYTSEYVLGEVKRVLVEDLGFPPRLAALLQRRIIRRSSLIEGRSRARVPQDPKDNPILQAALTCGADYLVSNDRHLLALDPFEGLRLISMTHYYNLLRHEGWID